MTADPPSGGPGDTAGEAVIVADPRRLILDESRQQIYSTPIGVRLLYQDLASGAEHYLIRYHALLPLLRDKEVSHHGCAIRKSATTARP